MKHSDVIDWRVWKAGLVAADSGAVKEGDRIYVVTKLEDSAIGPFSFVTPSPIALALEVAIRSARSAVQMRATLKTVPSGEAEPWFNATALRELYDFFQQCMISVTFSYQCLEAFSNHLICESDLPFINVERKKQIERWTVEEVERRCSTEEKLGSLIPQIAGVSTFKGTKLWERLQDLKDLRDSTIHLKGVDQYVRGAPDNQTLYYRFLSADLMDGPRTAIDIIRLYSHPDSLAWLVVPTAQLSSPNAA